MLLGLSIVVVVLLNSLSGKTNRTSLVTSSHSAQTTQTVQAPSFFVHVVGQVKSPGVYSLTVGARLFDAIAAAGGFLIGADQSSVNLARQLSDGEQISVLKIGEIPSPDDSHSGASGSVISLNRATEAELESLPGVGPALAGRIIDWRLANGGFKKKEDLLNVGGIGSKLFAGLSKLVSI